MKTNPTYGSYFVTDSVTETSILVDCKSFEHFCESYIAKYFGIQSYTFMYTWIHKLWAKFIDGSFREKSGCLSYTNIICEIKLEKGFSFIFFYEIYKNVNGKYFFPSCISIQPFLFFFMFTVVTAACTRISWLLKEYREKKNRQNVYGDTHQKIVMEEADFVVVLLMLYGVMRWVALIIG